MLTRILVIKRYELEHLCITRPDSAAVMFQGDIQGNPGLEAKAGGNSRKFWVPDDTCGPNSEPAKRDEEQLAEAAVEENVKRRSLTNPDMSWSGMPAKSSRWEVTAERNFSSTWADACAKPVTLVTETSVEMFVVRRSLLLYLQALPQT